MSQVDSFVSIKVKDINIGDKYEIQTKNTRYLLEHLGSGFYLSGSSTHFPEPTLVSINGCTYGGSIIKVGVIEEGMHLEVIKSVKLTVLTTSTIQSIRKV